MIEVVNIRNAGPRREGDVYIGRAGHGESGEYGNPYTIGRDGNRDEVCDKFEEWIKTQPQKIESLRAKNPKRLLCFCAPERCHGHTYKRILEKGA